MPWARCIEIIHDSLVEHLPCPARIHHAQYPRPREVMTDVSSFFSLVDIMCYIDSMDGDILSVFECSAPKIELGIKSEGLV